MKIKDILKEEKEKIRPEKEVFDRIEKVSKEFCELLREKLKKKKINADVFIGGSIAKETLARKNVYDIDIFVRFSEDYRGKDLSKLLKKIVKGKKVHGSRDYFQVLKEDIVLEVVPVLKIDSPEKAENVTDLSYFHVGYVLRKIKKKKKLADEIRLTKSFMQAQGFYGAESYVRGFSGYAIELLLIHYGSFLKFLKEMVGSEGKIVIDDKGFYKRKNVLRELNESKVKSPIVLIDPTFKERNALAGLGNETFERFRGVAKEFFKNPSEEFFKKRDIYKELKEKYGKKLKILEIKTKKQRGDIAGTKSKKFFNYFIRELGKEFSVVDKGFEYNEKKNVAHFYFVIKKKKSEIIKGPGLKNKKNVEKFKKAHPKTFIKNRKICAKVRYNLNFEMFLKGFKKKKKKIIKEMSVKKILNMT